MLLKRLSLSIGFSLCIALGLQTTAFAEEDYYLPDVPATPSGSVKHSNNSDVSNKDEYYLPETGHPNTASAPGLAPAGAPCADPYEHFNRNVYHFNKGLDKVLIRPLAVFYKKLLPPPLTKGIGNVFYNLNTVTTIINDGLQGDGHHVASDSSRLIINSTLGLGGLIDVAAAGGVPRHCEDFGLTMAKWGYCSSNYLVLPLLGPSTIRDTAGMAVDGQFFSVFPYIPWTYAGVRVYPYIPSLAVRYTMFGLQGVDKRAQLLDFDELIKQASIDPYVFERNAFLQYRAAKIAENNCGVHAESGGVHHETVEVTTTTTTTAPTSDNSQTSAVKTASVTVQPSDHGSHAPG